MSGHYRYILIWDISTAQSITTLKLGGKSGILSRQQTFRID